MKSRIIFFFLFFTLYISAQNFQLHYDFGKPENGPVRNYFVSTFEFFRPDTLGYTFLFVDFEYDAKTPSKGVSSGYFELSREFYLPWFHDSKAFRQLGFHIEYDGGSAIFNIDTIPVTCGTNIAKSWLTGFGYPVHIGKFTLNSMLLYKYIPDASSPDFQVTIAWFQMLFHNRVTLSGFFDFWTADNKSDKKDIVVYGEPQFWFNIHRKFSIGSEFKISKNFIPTSNKVEVFPTLGLKYTF
jgi:hypothetical protein